jgi:hypothetical protein
MHRLTARLVLLLLLVSVLTPLAVAAAGPQPHACCLAKMRCRHSSSRETNFHAQTPCRTGCCPRAVRAQWAAISSHAATDVSLLAAPHFRDLPSLDGSFHVNFSCSGRGPPLLSLA